eukprot:jgi/Bigna1/141712/aug1.64_g16420
MEDYFEILDNELSDSQDKRCYGYVRPPWMHPRYTEKTWPFRIHQKSCSQIIRLMHGRRTSCRNLVSSFPSSKKIPKNEKGTCCLRTKESVRNIIFKEPVQKSCSATLLPFQQQLDLLGKKASYYPRLNLERENLLDEGFEDDTKFVNNELCPRPSADPNYKSNNQLVREFEEDRNSSFNTILAMKKRKRNQSAFNKCKINSESSDKVFKNLLPVPKKGRKCENCGITCSKRFCSRRCACSFGGKKSKPGSRSQGSRGSRIPLENKIKSW